MPVLTVRVSEEEKALLEERAKRAGVSAGALVRQMLHEAPFTTAEELLEEATRRLGDKALRIRRRR
jgi:hypothetical protein